MLFFSFLSLLFLPVNSYFNLLLINPFLLRGDSGAMISSNGTDATASLACPNCNLVC
jgi:hypothetical protein